jgi:chromosome partitioning protein
MPVIALGQQKGGVGKSSTAIMLACKAAAKGKKTALLDMDVEQASSLKWGKKRKSRSPHVEACDASNIRERLESLRSEGYEWVFLDLPGRAAPQANAGLASSDFVVIPCRPVDLDIEPSASTVQAALRSGKPYGYLMNIAPPHKERLRARQVADALKTAGHTVIPTIIVQSVNVQDAISLGKCISEKYPGCQSDREYSELLDWIEENVK